MVLKVCICGGGNGSHMTSAWLGHKSTEYEVRILTRQPQRWLDGLKEKGGITAHVRKVEESTLHPILGKIAKVSDKPEEVCSDADVFICGGPGHANPVYLKKIAPFVKKGAFVIALYGQGGFDWAAKDILGKKFKDVKVVALQHIPWICTTLQYGKEVKMIGPKHFICISAIPRSSMEECRGLVSKLFDLPCRTLPNFLCITLTPSNQIIHPPRYYGIFKDWDGKKTYKPESIPLLYKGMDDLSADKMQKISDELQEIKKALMSKFPKLDLSSVKDLGQRIVEQYGKDVTDTTNLKTIFATNKGYELCKTPVKVVEGGVIPVLESRLFWEDIPYGLCLLRNIADMCGVKVPVMNEMIVWHQQFMKKEFLKNGNLNTELIGETGAPLRYNIKSLDVLVEDYI